MLGGKMPYEVFYGRKPRWEDRVVSSQIAEMDQIEDEASDNLNEVVLQALAINNKYFESGSIEGDSEDGMESEGSGAGDSSEEIADENEIEDNNEEDNFPDLIDSQLRKRRASCLSTNPDSHTTSRKTRARQRTNLLRDDSELFGTAYHYELGVCGVTG